MAIKKQVKVLEPKIVNKMKEEMEKKKIPMETLFVSKTYQRYLEKIAAYITGRNIKVIFTKTIETACTDNKKVYINPMMKIIDGDTSFESRNKIILALAHELFHILFTDFSTLGEISHYSGRKQLLKVVNNILEDSYIEYLGTQVYAGDFRSAILYIRWTIMEMYDELQTIESHTNQLVSALSHYGSCGMLKGELSKEIVPVWDEIQKIFDRGRKELDAQKRFNCSLSITRLIEPVADKEAAASPESPDPFFGDNMASAKGSSRSDKMTKEEIRKVLGEMDIHDLIEQARKLLENPEESEDEDDSSDEAQGGLKIGVKGPGDDEESSEGDKEGEVPDVIIDLSEEDNDDEEDSDSDFDSEDGPIVIKPDKKSSSKEDDDFDKDEDGSEAGKSSKEDSANEEDSDTEKDAEADEEFTNGECSGSGEGDSDNHDDLEREAGTMTGAPSPGKDSDNRSRDERAKPSVYESDSESEEKPSKDPRFEDDEKALKNLKEAMEKESERAAELEAELEKELGSELLDEAVEDEKSKEFKKISDKVKYGAVHSRVKNLIESVKYNGEGLEEEYLRIVEMHKDVITQTQRKMKAILKQTVEEHFVKQRLGNFDVKNADQMYKSGKVFHRTKDGSGKDIVFTVLVDESGSMYSSNNSYNAMQAAIVFKEVCDELKIPVLIMGFTTSGEEKLKCYHRIYSNFDSPRAARFSITEISARSNNRDGYSIRFAGEVMNNYYPKANKVLVVISDGEPADYYYDNLTSRNDTKYQVDYVEKKFNTPVIALNICNRRGIHEGMFKHIVEVPIFTQLPEKLINVLKKEFKKMI